MSTLARHDDPIVAIATAPGRGAVGIVRVSGRALSGFVRALLGRDLQPREVHYLAFPDARGEAIDRGLALWFPAPRSYTGEDVLELQAHGGPVVLQLLLARCLEVARLTLPRLRAAQPGEFTERAFLNDKLDLAQAEAVADLIDASTETAARSAARSLSGEFSAHVHAVRDALVQLRMLVEATLDFPEEEIDFLRKADARGQLSNLQSQVAAVLRQAHQGALLREGITVVIAGQPNVGKSSLLNALAGAELAIVTPIAGTTRDTVRQTIQIEGMPLHVIDTAGLRDSGDVVERIGIERAWQQIERADAVLFLHDLTRRGEAGCAAADAALGRELAGRLGRAVPLIDVWNKADAAVDAADGAPMQAVVLSALTGQGLQTLRERLLQVVGWQATPEGVFMARERHLQALKAVQAHLLQAAQLLEAPLPALDLMAEELRLAQGALGDITGEFTADDLLGTIFSRFCIGK
ncbi:MAG: tRNA uridine-5-carboxymethylaminomethyl(34) synthesis GTPase MnmE [Comamonas sp. SCN 67-35]|uniref:tRNA uridine-5-carboxymethylaminomethyl(34) synthesis GTPase MnmE n=1 Tax=unclassified Comamonas TaxID=2638500 RepID=UPI00086EC7D8|nr:MULTISPECIES: tRNA uridine-5-carboxymethylaminomethyl(34) synthesis GTPase MnmE [unclassified Comamonas]MBN9328747.1 tRNA uridine-5-carboxymethylaminomethyl(34) synthesis GTPase MnmE [Comamonas sp.]ODU38771.1 MAG: tRNA uridine-5-carboxymethylaminomethyl(34) synthesis GTPase MnmE [Comamonas sp. SCN 67-35]OJX02109.1 MAG: tRNA uridine-5-carboxymethylaminomethyl(34) synthesis GTPase MnmE [Burkholderiales bacterium 66-26]